MSQQVVMEAPAVERAEGEEEKAQGWRVIFPILMIAGMILIAIAVFWLLMAARDGGGAQAALWV